MDNIYINGKIYVDRGVFAEAMLVRDGVIVQVGTNKEVLAAGAEECELVNFEGKTVIPGFNDSHLHIQGLGRNLSMVELYNTGSMAELIERGRDFLAKHNPPAGKTLGGWGWNQDYFSDEVRIPNRHDLDKIATDRPVAFYRACGHICTINTKALEELGITGETPDPEGGQIGKDEHGVPNGIMYERASEKMIEPILPEPVAATFEKEIRAATDYASSMGLTMVQSNDITESNVDEMTKAIASMREAGDLACRYYGQNYFNTVAGFERFVKMDERSKNTDLVGIGPLKMFVDGSLGARTALLRGEYADDKNAVGIKTLPDEVFDGLVQSAYKNEYGVITHAIGDGAIEMVLDSYHKVIENGDNKFRNAIVHCQITDDELLDRIKADNLSVMAQPIFIHYDMNMVHDRVGDALASTSYAFGRLGKMGVNVSYGTDCPVEDLNPFNNLHCAVTRKGLEGDAVYLPEEKVDIYTAIDNYTVASAYECFMDGKLGRLKAGYLADFTVLDTDIFEVAEDEIKNIRPVMTFVGGVKTYEKK